MTVPKSERTPSRVDFFSNLYKLNDTITLLLVRDFGLKNYNKNLMTFCYNAKMAGEDRKNFIELCEKYHIGTESSYPLWLLEHYRDWILRDLMELQQTIVLANTIYVTTQASFDYRQTLQWKAVGCCKELLQTFQNAVRVLKKLRLDKVEDDVDIEEYMPYVELINAEIKSLQNWRKNDAKIWKSKGSN